MGIGMLGFIGLQEESSWGTAITTNSRHYIPAFSETLTFGMDRINVKNIIANLAEPDDFQGINNVAGNIQVPANPETLWFLARGLLYDGSSNATLTYSAGIWTSEYVTPETNWSPLCPVPSYTCEIYRDVTSSFFYTGFAISKIDISIEPNKATTLDVSVLAGNANIGSKTTPYFDEQVRPFAFDTASVVIAGSPTDLIETLTISIDNNLELSHVLNSSRMPYKIRRNSSQSVRLQGTLDFSTLAEYQKFINQEEYTIAITMRQVNSSLLHLEFPRIAYTSFTANLIGQERVVAQFEAFAKYSVTSNTSFLLKVKDVTDYDYFVIGDASKGIIGTGKIGF